MSNSMMELEKVERREDRDTVQKIRSSCERAQVNCCAVADGEAEKYKYGTPVSTIPKQFDM